MAVAKKFEVLRGFHRLNDKKDGEDRYEVGDDYAGPTEDFYLHPEGPDGAGPLVRERVEDKPAEKPADKAPTAGKDAV